MQRAFVQEINHVAKYTRQIELNLLQWLSYEGRMESSIILSARAPLITLHHSECNGETNSATYRDTKRSVSL